MSNRQLGPTEFIDVATTPIEEPNENKVDPADKAAMGQMFQAFGPKQMVCARRSDSILRRLHEELANVARQDGSTRVVTAASRTTSDPRLGPGSSTFRMVRDWDPTDPDTSKG